MSRNQLAIIHDGGYIIQVSLGGSTYDIQSIGSRLVGPRGPTSPKRNANWENATYFTIIIKIKSHDVLL